MKSKHYISLIALGLLTIAACKKDPPMNGGDNGNTPVDTVAMTTYEIPIPSRYPAPKIPEDNRMTVERVALGKKLFLDSRLSNDGSTCESCHQQKYGFSKDGVSIPDHGLTALPLINLAWYENFMWNARIIGTLEDVMYAEVTVRFQTDMAKINNIEEYKVMFANYYGVSEITAKDLAYALAQYMRTLVSKDTRNDYFFAGKIQLTAQEMRGRDVFFNEAKNGGGDCFHCHVQIITTDNMLHNNGVDSTYTKEIDRGYYNVTKDSADLGKFRTPNLRNVALRTSYMHDGRFKTLEEVVDFYDHGVNFVKTVDPLMTKPDKLGGLHLDAQQKSDLIAYLKTFTDSVMITNPEFAAE